MLGNHSQCVHAVFLASSIGDLCENKIGFLKENVEETCFTISRRKRRCSHILCIQTMFELDLVFELEECVPYLDPVLANLLVCVNARGLALLLPDH